jgi:hypothetical protein
MIPSSRRTRTRRRPPSREGQPYALIVRGPDGRARFERFDDAAEYRARLFALGRRQDGAISAVSIDEIAALLDP